MKEESITFNGKEAEFLTAEAIKHAVDMLGKIDPINDVFSLEHNSSKEDLLKVFNAFEITKDSENYHSILFGMPIYKRNYIPVGEIWTVNKAGKVLNKFKI